MNNPAIYFFVGAILLTSITTALLCRNLIARKKRAFYLAGLIGALLGNTICFVMFFLAGKIYSERWHIFTSEAWTSGNEHGLASMMADGMIFVVVGSLFCILPALGVAFYYARQSKKNEISGAK